MTRWGLNGYAWDYQPPCQLEIYHHHIFVGILQIGYLADNNRQLRPSATLYPLQGGLNVWLSRSGD